MITPFEVYLIMKLDSICIASVIVGLMSFVCAIFFCVGYLGEYSEDTFKKPAIVSVVVTLLCAIVAIVTPTTKQAAAIIMIPKIVNNEKIQDIGGKTLDVGNDLLDLANQYIQEQIKVEPKSK